MPHRDTDRALSVFLNDFPTVDPAFEAKELAERYGALFALRDDVMKALELARADKKIGKSLDAKLTVYTEDDAQYELLASFGEMLKTVFIVSGVKLEKGKAPEGALSETASGIGVLVEGADGCKCDRCWSFSTEGKQDAEGFLCARCLEILEG
jgi:isoleucyl-tRNA synthetase